MKTTATRIHRIEVRGPLCRLGELRVPRRHDEPSSPLCTDPALSPPQAGHRQIRRDMAARTAYQARVKRADVELEFWPDTPHFAPVAPLRPASTPALNPVAGFAAVRPGETLATPAAAVQPAGRP